VLGALGASAPFGAVGLWVQTLKRGRCSICCTRPLFMSAPIVLLPQMGQYRTALPTTLQPACDTRQPVLDGYLR
jgi:hypothetical protein